MYQISKLKNGLTLITIPVPQLESVTTLVAVGAGSRYETKGINGISHFLEHMFFKGSKKYPSTEIISTLVDGIGAVNNAGTEKQWTDYWIKSSAKHIELASDILSSMLKESLLDEEEIEREKGVIVEELRMYRDNPSAHLEVLFEELLYGDQPLGWDIGGPEKVINSLTKKDFTNYVDSLYAPENMALVYAGKLPKNIKQIAQKYFLDLPKRDQKKPVSYKKHTQTEPRIRIHFKKTEQAHVMLGVEGFDRYDKRRYAATLLSYMLGGGMSSRLFMQVRERRGLAYHVATSNTYYSDSGSFAASAGLKMEKVIEGLEIIRDEMEKIASELVSNEELNKAKEMARGRQALRGESTNYLAEHFGTQFVLDRKLESFSDYLKNIDAVTPAEILSVAKQLFQPHKYNLQVIGPFKDSKPFAKILK